MRAAIYVRISSDPEGNRAGVRRQRQDCAALIERNHWESVGVFEDNDRGAYHGKKRPGWAALCEAIEAGEIDVLVTWASDRLTRHPRELEDLVDLLEATGCRVATVTSGDLDLSTPEGRMGARIHGAVARQESERKSIRIKRAQRQAAEEGRRAGGRRAFGYRGGEIIEPEAELIRSGAEAVLAGETLAQIARDWNAAGISTPSGRPWRGELVRDVIRGPHLAGLRIYRGEVIGRGDWPPILEEATHRALEAVFSDPERKRFGKRAKSLLGALARCGACGAPMYAAKRADGRVLYRCRQPREGRPPSCGNVSAVAEPVDQIASAAFIERVLRPGSFALLTEGGADEEKRSEAARGLEELDRLERDLGARLASGGLSELVLQGAQAEIGKRRAELQAELRELSGGRPSVDPEELARLGEIWPELALSDQRAALKVLVEGVEIAPVRRRGGNRFDASRVSIIWR